MNCIKRYLVSLLIYDDNTISNVSITEFIIFSLLKIKVVIY